MRARLAGKQGRRYWRSLDELAQTDEFAEWLHREFPRGAAEWDETFSRRGFLRLMGASMALAGLSGCARGQPPEQIAPYVRQPESVVPGQPQYYATALSLGGFGSGVIVESHLGRPTKVEGNPQHPASLGATDVFAQAAPLTLYDPDRVQTPLHLGTPSSWDRFLPQLNDVRAQLLANEGAGLHILSETVTSPTLAAQIVELRELFPQMGWHQYEPINRMNSYAGAELVFGELLMPQYDLAQTDVILALDANFLAPGPGFLNYAREFARRRFVSVENPAMNRLYVVESCPGLTGAMADHRLALAPQQIERFVRRLANELGVDAGPVPALPADIERWLIALAADLREQAGRSLVLAGEAQPPVVHGLAYAINAALNNTGRTVSFIAPVEVEPGDQLGSLRELTAAMQAGEVEALFILEGNPAFTAPADIPFAEYLPDVPFSVHLGMYNDETARLCDWLISTTHTFEAWSDVRAFDGTASIIQSLIVPLYSGITVHELLAALAGNSTTSSYELLRGYWRAQSDEEDFELFWRRILATGLIPGTAAARREVTPDLAALRELPLAPEATGLTLIFQPDPSIWDGRFANNGWLQELPEPISKITWDNAAMISPATALRLGLENEQVVLLQRGGYHLRAAVWIVPGQVDETVALHLGYGRSAAGQVGNEVGFNSYALRTSDAFWFGDGLTLELLDETYQLATTQNHHTLEGRDLIRVGTQAQFLENPDFLQEAEHQGEGLFGEFEYPQAWAMSINLQTCIGCNACTIACQAENNIPIVGKEGVLRGREMHWIRVDRYFGGDLDNPAIYHQPVPCMHCETAPCELVCPVAATVHDAYNGLNAMIYNRCVGTRYCSNNCPYKVRRLNFFDYVNTNKEQLKLLRNPDVTVRSRGVMEKCTYCVQRINRARIEAETSDVPQEEVPVITACAQVCPTEAITFGNLKDPDSAVSRLRASPLSYGLLTELNTRPRTTYMARLRNLNPAIEDGVG